MTMLEDRFAGGGLSDEELLGRFEKASLRPGEFRHADHIRIAWLYLQRYPAAQALERFVTHLQRLAQALGADGLYHETITWSYLFLIRQRLVDGESWADFARRNTDLFQWPSPLLARYYSAELLHSERAKRCYLLPDRLSA